VRVFQRERQLRTAGGLAVRDITDDVNEAVRESGIVDGIACIYSPHTTCCVRVNEFETGFLEDFTELLRRLVPRETYYAHDDWDKRTENICPEDMDFGNGHSHCMAMLLGTAGESVPVRDGELCLGTWQRVLFIELDRERDRRWLVQVVGNLFEPSRLAAQTDARAKRARPECGTASGAAASRRELIRAVSASGAAASRRDLIRAVPASGAAAGRRELLAESLKSGSPPGRRRTT
jgi:secondary thiamine-phosphate synthase enzyme